MSKKHAIRLPGVLLDELKVQSYDADDRRFDLGSNKQKRGGKRKAPLSRKEQRRQQREVKKAKRTKPIGNGVNNINNSTHKDKPDFAKTSIGDRKPSLKAKKLPVKDKKQVRFSEEDDVKVISSDDEISSGDFDEFDEDDLNEEEWEQLHELEGGDDEQEASDESSNDFSEADEDEVPLTAKETMNKLKALKAKKNVSAETNSTNGSISDESLSADDFDEEDFDEDIDSDDEQSNNMTVEETMAALRAMKEKKSKSSSDDCKSTVKSTKETVKKPKKRKEAMRDLSLTPEERAAIERDKLDMEYYASKLGLRKGKKLRASDEYDAIGGLLEGLDYFDNYGEEESDAEPQLDIKSDPSDENISEDEVSSESEDNQESDVEEVENPFSSDDELSSDDFDDFDEDDLDEEEWEQLRELEGGKSSTSNSKKKENIYSAPVEEGSTYIAPSLRKKQLDESGSETTQELQRKVKSSLNKLSDSNTTVIVSTLNELYDSYARQYVNDSINQQMIEVISQKNKLLDSFILNYAGVAFSIWKLRGTEAGASFIQTLVQKFLNTYDEQKELAKTSSPDQPLVLSKEASNLLTLLSYSYNFGLISSRLIYDIIKELIQTPNEYTTELLLRIISVSGPLIRGDDPRALKDIITGLLTNVKQVKQTPRLGFLLDTLSDLKNNRLKPSIVAPSHQTLKKTILGSLHLSNSSSSEPLLASLDDIRNVETKGKWWLIGASWKGNQNTAFDEAKNEETKTSNDTKTDIVLEDDDMLSGTVDWNEIAKQQRINTDVRRAIFVCIMSADDYLDAFAKLEKLNLKSKQSLEIPRILLHCLSNDDKSFGYNPYYSLLGGKLCEHNHKLLKSFQFLFWEVVKKLETDPNSEDDSDSELFNIDDETVDEKTRVRRLMKQGRFFGYLIAQAQLRLDIFKHVPLMGGLSPDGIVFFDVLLFQLFLTLGKNSEKRVKKNGKKCFEYDSSDLISLFDKGISSENSTVILKALKWFMKKHFTFENYISGEPGSKEFDREKRRLSWSIPKFSQAIDDNLQ